VVKALAKADTLLPTLRAILTPKVQVANVILLVVLPLAVPLATPLVVPLALVALLLLLFWSAMTVAMAQKRGLACSTGKLACLPRPL
jgi:hypothetical protein